MPKHPMTTQERDAAINRQITRAIAMRRGPRERADHPALDGEVALA